MSTSFAILPLTEVHDHIHNPRRRAIADPEMVESIRTNGLVQPLIVAPATNGDGYVLIAGHRRKNGLEQAGQTTAPAVIRLDLATEAQQIEAMLIENGRREDLTPIEEADGYEQLELFGYKPKDIAKATGRAETTVRARLKLRNLSTATRTKLHEGQVTIHDALELLEFTDQPKVLEELEAATGTSNFAWKLQQAKARKAEHAVQMKLRSRIAALGIPEAPKVDSGFWDFKSGPYPLSYFPAYDKAADGTRLSDESAHDGCLAWTESAGTVQLTCSDPARHRPKAAEPDPEAEKVRQAEQEDFERRQAERRQRAEANAAAAAVRVDHGIGVLEQAKLPDVLVDMVQHLLPAWAMNRTREYGGVPISVTNALGYTYTVDADHLARDANAWTRKQVTHALAALLLHEAEDVLECGDFRRGDEGDAQALDLYFGWLTDTDHAFCDVDNELRDQVTAALTEDEDEEAVS